jgi:hypothetical protein
MYFVDILALKLRDKSRETLIITLDTDGFEDALDVLLGRRGVAPEGEEEVCCEVLHSVGLSPQISVLLLLLTKYFEVDDAGWLESDAQERTAGSKTYFGI